MGEQDRTGYAVNFAGKRRDHIANLDDRKMAEARARSEAKANRQATEVIERSTRRVVYRVGFGRA